jgi:RNA recognition motif-containing protein
MCALRFNTDSHCSQVRQGIANNTKGTAFVVYEDVADAKQACDKLNGFNFQNRYLVGASTSSPLRHNGSFFDDCVGRMYWGN